MISLLLLALVGVSGETISTFAFPSNQQARKNWNAAEGTPPVKVSDTTEGKALHIDAPLASKPQLRRVVIDRDVKLSLAAPTSFTLDVNLSHPEWIEHVTLYFHSVDGWFSAGNRVPGKGWQTLRFAKSAFGTEEMPGGWHDIDRIRIACWRSSSADAKSGDAVILLRNLTANWNNTAILVPDSAEDQWIATYQAADTMQKMLGELGVGVDRLTESSLTQGSLGRRGLVLLPFNRPNEDVCRRLVALIRGGGKLFLGYDVPAELQDAIGFRGGQYYKPSGDQASLASIRFDADQVPGLPRSVEQASWNITTFQPAGHGARVIGWWHDASGNPTGKPAVLLSDRAAYLSHIVLPDDWDAKKRALAAVLGKLEPKLWHEIVAERIQRAEQIGHCRSGKELAEALGRRIDDSGREQLRVANTALAQARELLSDGKGFEASQAADRCRVLRANAYLKHQPSPPGEARAFWEHSGAGAYPGDWDRTCRELAQAGFNMVIPNMLWAGAAHYRSDVLPRSKTFEQYGDQIDQCLAAARKHGLEVHVWKVFHNPGHHAPKEFVDRMRRSGRTQVDRRGEVADWLNPVHPENIELEVASMLEVVRNYDVDGIHFDYIRYPSSEFDYSDLSRRRFESDTGLTVTNWPGDCHSGQLRDQYRDWRTGQITRLVETISRRAREIQPGIKVSAAVFASYPACRQSVAQDWPLWARRGYVDFLCPMSYTDDDQQFARWVRSQKQLAGNVPIYPGIGATASRISLSADRVVGQIHLARQIGAAGFTVFNLTEKTAASILPGIRAGAGRHKAIPPHAR